MCFRGRGIFSKDILKKDEIEKYINFLKGDFWDDNLVNIDYDDVTIKLIDHVHTVALYKTNGLPCYYIWPNNNCTGHEKTYTIQNSNDNFPFYTSFRHGEMKCFTLDLLEENMPGIKEKRVQTAKIELKNITKLESAHLAYYMHYPGQLFRGVVLSVEHDRTQGLIQGNFSSKNFWIDSVDIVRSRNTLHCPCIANSMEDENSVTKNLFKNIQCKPPNWKNAKYPVCTDKVSMKKAYINEALLNDPSLLANVTGPCDQMKTVTFTVQDVPLSENDIDRNNGTIYVVFKNTVYKEILHIQALDIESLVGNMGGYIGLFLGFAIWQVPDAIKIILNVFDKFVRK